MKILVASDSYKGSLTSMEVGNAIRQGVLAVYPEAKVKVMPLADGGEGTCEAIATATNGVMKTVTVTSPVFGRKVSCQYAIVGKTAVIEMACCAGITLVSGEEKNPLYTTTYGVGEMIFDAIKNGCTDFVLGLGGSATNDCGVGMLKALGYSFLDESGNEVPYGAIGLKSIASICDDNRIKELDNCRFVIACDVENPLCGESGCSYVFAKQKGATDNDIALMDEWIHNFATLANANFGTDFDTKPGSGAAGGMGYALFTFLKGEMKSGAQVVLEKSGMEDNISDADLVITGEGKMDGQSVFGKAPITFAKLAKRFGKPVLAFCGCLGDDVSACKPYVDGYFSILNEVADLEKALDANYASKNLTATVEQVFRVMKIDLG